MRAKIEEKDRYAVLILREEGYSMKQIADKLQRSSSCIHNILQRFKETGSVNDRHRSGRPQISNERDQRHLIRLVKENRRLSSTELANKWTLSSGCVASPRTVRKVLQNHNYLWRSACKKPRLTDMQKKRRLDWCNHYKTFSKESWRDVFFSDEMNVEVDQRKGRIMLRRTPGERMNEDCVVKRTKQGSGSIGIWACMSYNGIGFFKLFDGRLNSEAYIEILGDHLLPSIDLLRESQHVIFQQDNAPCHTAKKVKAWFDENKINVMPWPANSPDLNCIENLWSWLDRELSKVQICNLDQLKSEIIKNLNNVPISIVHNLVDSMPNRIQECLKVKGGSTRY